MLTRDADIVDVRFIVQYRIRSATDYLFRSVDPERSVSQAAQAAVRAIVGTRSAADVLNQDRDLVLTMQGWGMFGRRTPAAT